MHEVAGGTSAVPSSGNCWRQNEALRALALKQQQERVRQLQLQQRQRQRREQEERRRQRVQDAAAALAMAAAAESPAPLPGKAVPPAGKGGGRYGMRGSEAPRMVRCMTC